MLFDNNDIDLDFSLLNLSGLKTSKDMNMNYDSNIFLPAKEGFLRGNLFKNEYKPYKNLTYINIRPKSDREAKLFTVMQYAFAITDLNLYLDTHPDDLNAIHLLENMIEERRKAKKEFVDSFGPITIGGTKGNKFEWIQNPWPWDNMGGNMYV